MGAKKNMGINFERTTHGKVGDIIPPAYNGTNLFLAGLLFMYLGFILLLGDCFSRRRKTSLSK